MRYEINKRKNKKANSHFKFSLKRNMLLNSKCSQVTIFIILAMIIVVGIIILFLLIKKPNLQIIDEENPQAYIESCTRDAVKEALDILMPQGGDIEPELSIMYKDIERAYLCYNANYYNPCINQRPLLIEHIENEITNYITPKVEVCFQSLKNELGKRYEVEIGEMQLTTDFKINNVLIEIKRDLQMTIGNTSTEFTDFKTNLIHPIYELAEIAMEIANQEAEFCSFYTNGFNSNYPKYEVRQTMTEESEIYTIIDKKTNQKFIFAIRGCVMPAGG